MVRRPFLLVLILLAAAAQAGFSDVRFSIRYQDKKIYYPGDAVSLKVTLTNDGAGDPAADDELLFIADDMRQSFAFDVRNLQNEPVDLAEGYASALDRGGAYRVVHLAPGQEISFTVDLADWVDITEPGQYRVDGFYYPRLRGSFVPPKSAVPGLDLSVLPQTDRRWEDRLDEQTRTALVQQNLDPWGVVSYVLDARKQGRNNRAVIYLDLDELSRTLPGSRTPAQLEDRLLAGAWDGIPGLELPPQDVTLISSRVLPEEAIVRLRAAYEPQGDRYERELWFYLHRTMGYWSVRRIERLDPDPSAMNADPLDYGRSDLDPRGVVREMLNAAKRGDWEIVLRYLDLEALVKELPDYRDRWNSQMSAAEQRRAVERYRQDLISGTLPAETRPFFDLGTWTLEDVSYGTMEGNVRVRNVSTYDTAAGSLSQPTEYIFRLENRGSGAEERWVVIRYEIHRLDG